MKAKIFDVKGKEKGTITLPEFFSEKVREDIISRVIEAKKKQQAYSPSPLAGNQQSASGIIIHRRKVWKSGYGRGKSRVPRKIMSRKGSQFNWQGATVPNTKGGRRAHPPKTVSMINVKKINKKELKIALAGALSASVSPEFISRRYENLEKEDLKTPYIFDSKIVSEKIKDVLSGIKNVLGEKTFKVLSIKKTIRAGRGKLRGRKHKKNAGILFVIGNEEKMKSKVLDIKNVRELSVVDLANGGVGRVTIYTENAIKDLEKRFGEKNE